MTGFLYIIGYLVVGGLFSAVIAIVNITAYRIKNPTRDKLAPIFYDTCYGGKEYSNVSKLMWVSVPFWPVVTIVVLILGIVRMMKNTIIGISFKLAKIYLKIDNARKRPQKFMEM